MRRAFEPPAPRALCATLLRSNTITQSSPRPSARGGRTPASKSAEELNTSAGLRHASEAANQNLPEPANLNAVEANCPVRIFFGVSILSDGASVVAAYHVCVGQGGKIIAADTQTFLRGTTQEMELRAIQRGLEIAPVGQIIEIVDKMRWRRNWINSDLATMSAPDGLRKKSNGGKAANEAALQSLIAAAKQHGGFKAFGGRVTASDPRNGTADQAWLDYAQNVAKDAAKKEK